MKRLVTIQLIAGYLFATLILSHVHNHPLSEPENDTCPAFIIASVVNSDDVPTNLNQVEAPAFSGAVLQILPSELHSQITLFRTSNRAPPVLC